MFTYNITDKYTIAIVDISVYNNDYLMCESFRHMSLFLIQGGQGQIHTVHQ